MRIAFDVDEVLYSFSRAVGTAYGSMYPKTRTVKPTEWSMREAWDIPQAEWDGIVARPVMYGLAGHQITDGLGAMHDMINAGHEVHVVTARPVSMAAATVSFLVEYFDIDSLAGVHFMTHGEKHRLDVDILVDDSLDECRAFVESSTDRYAVMPARPWNHTAYAGVQSGRRFQRVQGVHLSERLTSVVTHHEHLAAMREAPTHDNFFVQGPVTVLEESDTLDPRADILGEAKRLVTSDRNVTHGAPEDNFSNIAALWAPYVNSIMEDGRELDALDVSVLMALFKAGRMMSNRHNRDNFADLIGYTACGWRVSQLMEKDA